jgi:hypothetical protein
MTVVIKRSPMEWLAALGRGVLVKTDGTGVCAADALNDNGHVLVAPVIPDTAAVVQGTTNATPDTADEIEFDYTSINVFVSAGTDGIVQFSFDGGTSYLSLNPGESFSIDIAMNSIHVKSAVAGAAYTVIVGSLS